MSELWQDWVRFRRDERQWVLLGVWALQTERGVDDEIQAKIEVVAGE